MTSALHHVEIVPSSSLSVEDFEDIIDVCLAAYGQDLRPFFSYLNQPTHLLIRQNGKIVSHACIGERWLKQKDDPPMRTAYVEAVATHPEMRRKGFASDIMQRSVMEAAKMDFELAALCTGRLEFYSRLGWELWRGPLYCRKDGKVLPCFEEEDNVMIYKLSRSPLLDLSAPLSVEWRGGLVW